MIITRSSLCGKGPVVAVPGADTVGSYNSKMISSIPSQTTDVGSNIPVRVSSVTLYSRGAPVIGRGAILEIDGRGLASWINCRVQSGVSAARDRRR